MTILHLEDSEIDALMVESIVHEAWPDCRLLRVASRSEFEFALEFEQFDLVLSDHQMPGYDGLSALHRLRQHSPEKPFLFMSGTIGEERAIEAMKHGADDYVIKDRPARLVPAIRQALQRIDDASRRRRMEEALRQNQERFRQIAENVEDLIAVLDLEGRRVYVNPAYRKVLGQPEALRGTNAFLDVHPDDRERVRAAFQETVRSSTSRRLEYRLVSNEGTVRYIEAQLGVLRQNEDDVTSVLAVSRDVTERRAAEIKLREQASLLDKARDAILTIDLHHHITYWNASAERIYGWPAADALGKDVVELGLNDPARFAAAYGLVLDKGDWQGHFQARTRDGKRLEIATRWTLVLDGAGKPQSILRIDTDVTEAKQLETQLLRAARAESMGTLTAGVAHDLNNVLAPILMGAELLRATPLDEQAQRLVKSMEASAQHGAALVRQLLSFARGVEGERVQVHPRALLEDVAKLLRQSIPPRIAIKIAAAGAPPPILADATQLKQLLINLCLNARDATPGEGTITLAVGAETLDPGRAQSMPEGRTGSFLRFAVSDTGTGMPPDIIERIFDPFFTTKEVGKGTGLGLSMARGIVKGHEGFLHVESTVGVGTTFHIFLPQGEVSPTAPAPFPDQGGNGETAVVIANDPDVRDMVRAYLERNGYRVPASGRTTEAMALLNHPALAAAVLIADSKPYGCDAAIEAWRIKSDHVALVLCADVQPNQSFIHPRFATIRTPLEPPKLLAALRGVLAAAATPLTPPHLQS